MAVRDLIHWLQAPRTGGRLRPPPGADARGWRFAPALLLAAAGALGSWAPLLRALADEAPDVSGQSTPPPTTLQQAAAQAPSWFDVSRLPFIPVPEVGVDPDSGVTTGVLPVWLHNNDQHEITRIIAPDLLYNPYFGYGGHFRVFAYPSADEQWSFVAGAKERVEREFDGEYQIGRLRNHRWTLQTSLIYDRSGVPRFYGVGNKSPLADQSNYTNEQELAQIQAGLNLNHTWQLLFTGRAQNVDVEHGTLSGVPDIYAEFPHVRGLGNSDQRLARFSVVYDTRDDQTITHHGSEFVVYGGLSSREGILNDSLYSEAGLDGRTFMSLDADTVLAAHAAIRYMPSTQRVDFWMLSCLGGGESDIGGEQLLRGFGAGRFCDRNLYSGTVELRHRVLSFDAEASHVDIEVTPFVDLGRVFAQTYTDPLSNLHKVVGVGFRGIAPPSVVGYVDVGYGTEGVAVFTGINYPF